MFLRELEFWEIEPEVKLEQPAIDLIPLVQNWNEIIQELQEIFNTLPIKASKKAQDCFKKQPPLKISDEVAAGKFVVDPSLQIANITKESWEYHGQVDEAGKA